MKNISLEKRIEQKYKVKAVFKNEMIIKSFLMPTKRFSGGFYFEDARVEDIYQRCLRINNSRLICENIENEKELEIAFLNKDINLFLTELSKNKMTIKRSYIERYSKIHNYNFKVLDFTNNSNWSFTLNNNKFLVTYRKIEKV